MSTSNFVLTNMVSTKTRRNKITFLDHNDVTYTLLPEDGCNADSFGEIVAALKNKYPNFNVNLNNVTVTEIVSNAQIVDNDTQLHKNTETSQGITNECVFISSIKKRMNSGVSDYKTARAKIKLLIEKDGDKAKAYFNQGKNYTNKSTEELIKLVNNYKDSSPCENTKNNIDSKVLKAMKECTEESNIKVVLEENDIKVEEDTMSIALKHIQYGINILINTGTIKQKEADLGLQEKPAWELRKLLKK